MFSCVVSVVASLVANLSASATWPTASATAVTASVLWSYVSFWASVGPSLGVSEASTFGALHRFVKWSVPLQLKNSLLEAWKLPPECVYSHMHIMCIVMASWCIDMDVEEVTLIVVTSAHPFSLAFWYCSHLDSSNLQWEEVSSAWFAVVSGCEPSGTLQYIVNAWCLWFPLFGHRWYVI